MTASSDQESLLANAMDHLDVGLVLFAPNYLIQYANQFLLDRYQQTIEGIAQQPLSTLLSDIDLSHLKALVDKALSSQQRQMATWPCTTSDNLLNSALLYPLTDNQNQPHLCLVLYDNTVGYNADVYLKEALRALAGKHNEQSLLANKLEQIHKQLVQSEKMAGIGQLAAGVAHEINNPIGFVFSNLKTLADYVKNLLQIIDTAAASEQPGALQNLMDEMDYAYIRDDVTSLLEESEDGLQRVKKIIQSLKDFSHIDEEAFQPADLIRGLDTTLNVVHNEIKYKAEVIKDYQDLPPVDCIASQINQVAMNLLVNAAHAIEEFGTITLRTGTEGDEAWFEVQDTGKGIDTKHLSRIFDPFFTTKPIGKGTGLGLSLSYTIVEKHHGRIEVDSTVGVGTRFRVWLPIKQHEPEAQEISA
ncbi:His Kinase A (phospho-acceptor) domain-containing protein [Atopomonas hussainii]|uniref:histidine kinase n=1 Tax=Atopomonas hussainii TaxID=1429083 RepID=A0A1H7K336_9GAMM|nr:ATP-binding protein [Atopomonas hussainii]SEK80926.1 His Kinase A (phospho-acceptor) domain-containing protein [Atopomonas hussainii]